MTTKAGPTTATFRTESPLEYIRGPGKQKTPEEEGEEAGRRIIRELKKLREQQEKRAEE